MAERRALQAPVVVALIPLSQVLPPAHRGPWQAACACSHVVAAKACRASGSAHACGGLCTRTLSSAILADLHSAGPSSQSQLSTLWTSSCEPATLRARPTQDVHVREAWDLLSQAGSASSSEDTMAGAQLTVMGTMIKSRLQYDQTGLLFAEATLAGWHIHSLPMQLLLLACCMQQYTLRTHKCTSQAS